MEHRLSQMKLSDLQKYAKNIALDGYSKYRKSELVKFIIDQVQRKKFLKTFNFDEALFSIPKKPRKKQIKCEICDKYYKHKKQHEQSLTHRNASVPNDKVEERESSFENRLKTYWIHNIENVMIPVEFLKDVKNYVMDLMKEILNKEKQLKVNFRFFCEYKRGDEVQEHSFKTQNKIILKSSNLNEFYDYVIDKLMKEADDFEGRGSGWALAKIKYLEVAINKYDPLKGSSYIDLPDKLKSKKAIVNVKNNDNKCFMWSILSALYPVDMNAKRVKKYEKYKDELNFKGIQFPVSLDDVKKFEKMNNISVNVYGYEKSVYPLRITENKLEKHVNLLYIKDEKNEHYCWIKSTTKLMINQISSRRILICDRCLLHFYSEERLKAHEEDCKFKKPVRVNMPKEEEFLEFKKYEHSMRVPFVIYADFESKLKKIDTYQSDPSKSYTMKYQKHEANNFCYYIKYNNGLFKAPIQYRGKDAVKKFITIPYSTNCYRKLSERFQNHFNVSHFMCNISERILQYVT